MPPIRASSPPRTQTDITRPNSGTPSETACGFLKMPEPMTVPITTQTAIQKPRTRGRDWTGLAGSDGVDMRGAEGMDRGRTQHTGGGAGMQPSGAEAVLWTVRLLNEGIWLRTQCTVVGMG